MAKNLPPSAGITEVELHGMNRYQAKLALEAALRRAGREVYRIRVIHGYRGGTELQRLVREEIVKNKRVLRCEIGLNPGQTDLVLREWTGE